ATQVGIVDLAVEKGQRGDTRVGGGRGRLDRSLAGTGQRVQVAVATGQTRIVQGGLVERDGVEVITRYQRFDIGQCGLELAQSDDRRAVVIVEHEVVQLQVAAQLQLLAGIPGDEIQLELARQLAAGNCHRQRRRHVAQV